MTVAVTRRRRLRVRVSVRRNLLARDDHLAFLQITIDNFRCRTITQSDCDSATIRFAVLSIRMADL